MTFFTWEDEICIAKNVSNKTLSKWTSSEVESGNGYHFQKQFIKCLEICLPHLSSISFHCLSFSLNDSIFESAKNSLHVHRKTPVARQFTWFFFLLVIPKTRIMKFLNAICLNHFHVFFFFLFLILGTAAKRHNTNDEK